jgi:hypothetical protein
MPYEIGLLKLDKNSHNAAFIIPSQLQGIRIGQRYEFSLGAPEKFPPQNLLPGRSSFLCWNFKADLLLRASSAEEEAPRSMRGLKVIPTQDGGTNIQVLEPTFHPHEAAEKFLEQLCITTVQRLQEIFGQETKLHFYFSAPGYDKKESKIYRDNIRSILKKLSSRPLLKGVNFPQTDASSKEQFLYEQYGVYYYFTRCEGSVQLERPKANYLIIDIGGSTTDIAIVHLSKSGNIARAFPIYRSFQYGGANYNQKILEYLVKNEQVSEKRRDVLIRKIERAKIEILENPGKYLSNSYSIKMGSTLYTLSKTNLEELFDEQWTWIIKRYILEVLLEAEQDERINYQDEPFQINGVLLAGGGTKLERFQYHLQQDQELKRYFSDDFVILSSQKTHPSSLAAIGLGISVAERISKFKMNDVEQPGELPTAEEIHFKIYDHTGKRLNIHRNGKKAEQSILFSISELIQRRASKRKNKVQFPTDLYTPDPTAVLPDSVTLQFTTDCNPDIQSLQIPLTIPSNTGKDTPEQLHFAVSAIETSSRSQDINSTRLRLEPYFFQFLPLAKRLGRCGRQGNGTPKIDISLSPKSIEASDDAVQVCVDFGMSNTSVAVFAPGRMLDQENFLILPVVLPDEIKQLDSQSSIPKGDFFTNGDKFNEDLQLPVDPLAAYSEANAESEVETEIQAAASEDFRIGEGNEQSPDSQGDSFTRLEQAIHNLAQELRINSERTADVIQNFIAYTARTESTFSQSKETEAQSEEIILPIPSEQYPDKFFEFEKFVLESGYRYEREVLRKIWTQSVNQQARLTVLAGPPGSGKTALVFLLAQFFNRDLKNHTSKINPDYFYWLEPVLPSWFSSESLLGFYNQISQSFHPTKFLQFLQRAENHYSHTNRKFFVCLDEFNLAQPEQYLAKVLSVIESRDRRMLVCQETGKKVTLTPNLKLFATINTDAASKALSPKVLDRSVLIRIIPSESGVIAHANKFSNLTTASEQILNELKSLLGLLFELSNTAGTPFGYRTIDSVISYIQSHPYTEHPTQQVSESEIKEVIDEILCCLFLSKLPGRSRFEEHADYAKSIQKMLTELGKRDLKSSINVLRKIDAGYPGQSAF